MASEAETPAGDAAAIAADTSKADMVRLYDPKSEQYGMVPAAKVQAALAAGLVPEVSATKAALHGAAQGLTLGFSDELAGAASAAAQIPQAVREGSLDPVTKAYTESRDTVRDDAAAAHEQHPYVYNASQFAGALPAAFAVGPGVGASAALGAVQGLGHTASLQDPTQVVRDVGTSAIASMAPPAMLRGAGAAAPALENLAGKAVLRAGQLTPDALGATGAHEAVEVGKQALREPGLVPPLLSRRGVTPESLAANATKTTQQAGKDLGDTYAAFDQAHGPTVPARELALRIKAAAADAVRTKPEMAAHVAKAIRTINPAQWDALVAQAKAAGPEEVRRLAEVIKTSPQKLINPAQKLTLAQVQGIINDLRGLGAYPKGAAPNVAELTAKKDVYSPAWSAGARVLKDTAGRVGGPEAQQAVEAARARYGLNSAVKGAAESADRSGSTVAPLVPDAAKAAMGAGIGALSGHGTPGAAVGALAAPVIGKMIAPRLPRILDNAAQGAQALQSKAPALDAFTGTFGRMFANQPPERRTQIDHKLQELSPRYRELRRKADEEKSRNPVEEKKPID